MIASCIVGITNIYELSINTVKDETNIEITEKYYNITN